MRLFEKKTPWEKEWELLKKKEKQYLERKKAKQTSAWNRFLEEKLPENLQERLDTAFVKAFGLIFEKGTGVIERTYQKQKMEQDYQILSYTEEVRKNRKSLKAFGKRADFLGRKNLLLSGVEGIGLGLMGIGLPDIPLFTGMILKSMYEIALQYGFGYETEEERYFILLVIRAALSEEKEWERTESCIETFLREEHLPVFYDRTDEIEETAQTLSKKLLYMKFLQGFPVVGAVGGAYDAVYLKEILQYAGMKYKKRFLLKKKNSPLN